MRNKAVVPTRSIITPRPHVSTPEELESLYPGLLVSLKCNMHSEYNAKFTGDMVADFAQFTLLQSGDPKNGYRSDNPTDVMAKYAPKIPYKDGRFYHTVMDIGYPTYCKYFPGDTVMDFYEMTYAKRGVCVSNFINSGKLTSSALVNILITYIIWGGSLSLVLLIYHNWYPESTLQKDAINDEYGTFIKLLDVRRYVYSNLLSGSKINGLGWDRGIINFWRLFKNYYKK